MDLNDTNSTDNNNDNIQQDKPKRTRNRLTKKQQYSKEREELIQQLNNIIGIDDKKIMFFVLKYIFVLVHIYLQYLFFQNLPLVYYYH